MGIVPERDRRRKMGGGGRTVTEVPTSMKLIIKLIEFT